MNNKNGNAENGGSLTLERRAKILEILETQGQVRVDTLSDLFGVSVVTIRNDFDKLEEKGLLIRTRGGGIRNQRIKIDYRLNREATLHLREKQLIGKKAASLVNDKDTVLLDSGTTTLEIAKNLTSLNDLTVVTNALNIADQFVDNLNVTVVMPGGRLHQSTVSLSGPMAEDNVGKLFCDKMFLGVNGIDSKHGFYKAHVEDAHLKKMMMHVSREIIVVADSSKFLKRSFSLLAQINELQTVVTDAGAPKEELENLKKAGVNVIIAEGD